MQAPDPFILLNQLIVIKEAEQLQQGTALKEHFRETYESLKPINILKSTFKKASSSPNLKSQLTNTAIGMTTGFLAKNYWEEAQVIHL